MSFSVVIPARYGSSRLPGKPLQDIAGLPMVQRVWQQAASSAAERVIIATDDQRIADCADAFGAEVCMTRADHPSGTDRLQEVVTQFDFADDHIVVNVQGDEPLIPPAVIDQVANNLQQHTSAGIATLCERIESVETLWDPNAVKVVSDTDGIALYFSRATIPWPRDAYAAQGGAPDSLPAGDWFRHIGIYAYRTGFLHRYITWAPAPLERLEQLEQLRALYHGVGIHVAEACAAVPGGVDTAEDLERLRELLEGEQ
ncbi:3-deoxy-manno-octulosonate cytidylyltransferase [Parahaliea maris]|uniref:3-deoxy-manno-octulosonate cytidylyltransferase n=1 Tax=Parahaliea maris TaxID=2716870 RepID=A0A5C8ZZP7_9GAMM|nr:3-deoxy-manno-octulosonate cytidylyltransferase [Parahaliea maris]TXS93000.1 3-deoxy-manno-octulosonate cytidylyltransferase [Parahaliea maris]